MIKTYYFYPREHFHTREKIDVLKIRASIGDGWRSKYEDVPAWFYYNDYSLKRKKLCWDMIPII
jgi:hypothetical protein